jgi:hypothetical protein
VIKTQTSNSSTGALHISASLLRLPHTVERKLSSHMAYIVLTIRMRSLITSILAVAYALAFIASAPPYTIHANLRSWLYLYARRTGHRPFLRC